MLLPPVTPGPYREMENIPGSGVFGEQESSLSAKASFERCLWPHRDMTESYTSALLGKLFWFTPLKLSPGRPPTLLKADKVLPLPFWMGRQALPPAKPNLPTCSPNYSPAASRISPYISPRASSPLWACLRRYFGPGSRMSLGILTATTEYGRRKWKENTGTGWALARQVWVHDRAGHWPRLESRQNDHCHVFVALYLEMFQAINYHILYKMTWNFASGGFSSCWGCDQGETARYKAQKIQGPRTRGSPQTTICGAHSGHGCLLLPQKAPAVHSLHFHAPNSVCYQWGEAETPFEVCLNVALQLSTGCRAHGVGAVLNDATRLCPLEPCRYVKFYFSDSTGSGLNVVQVMTHPTSSDTSA